VLQYGLCQHLESTYADDDDDYLLEEVPPVVPRPMHPVWGATAAPHNIAAHRQAFWALALIILAQEYALDPSASRGAAEVAASLTRTVHCALSRLRFDIATLPPGALCGDPPRETALDAEAFPAARPDRDVGFQVDWARLKASPVFAFNPSRAHGPPPRVAVALDATPTIDREHVFAPHPYVAANVSVLLAALESCTPVDVPAESMAWLEETIASLLGDFDAIAQRAGSNHSHTDFTSRNLHRLSRDSRAPSAGTRSTSQVLPPAVPTVPPKTPDFVIVGGVDEAAWSDDCAHIMQLGSTQLDACMEGCAGDARCNAVRGILAFHQRRLRCLARRFTRFSFSLIPAVQL
jgi:hypothetical protein